MALASKIGPFAYKKASAKTGEGVREVNETVAELAAVAGSRKKQGRFRRLLGIWVEAII